MLKSVQKLHCSSCMLKIAAGPADAIAMRVWQADQDVSNCAVDSGNAN